MTDYSRAQELGLIGPVAAAPEVRDWATWDAEHYGDAKPSLTVGDKSYTEFFHGTDAVLKPGDIVTPGKETGKSQFDKVSLATHPGDAKHYGEHVYRVTPQNDLTQGRIVRDGRPTAYTGKAIVQEELQGVEEKKTDLERIADGEDPDYVRKTTGVSRSEYFADRATSAETIARVEAHVRRNTLAWEERDWATWDADHPYIKESEARGNSRSVSASEFQSLASKGESRLSEIQSDSRTPTALNDADKFQSVKDSAFAETQKPWGGQTIDPASGKATDFKDGYTLAIRPVGGEPLTLPETASKADFDKAMDTAKEKYSDQLQGSQTYLGVFHDDDLNRIDIDPVVHVQSTDDVESIGAATHAVGGAYEHATGNGYFPPHVKGS